LAKYRRPVKPDDTGKARPVTKISSLPEIGTVVVQVLVLLLNVVVAQVALGLKTICPLGTDDENALDVTVEQLKLIVAPELGISLAWRLTLNQMVLPAGIAVPLKFAWMHDVAHGGHGGYGVGLGHRVGQGPSDCKTQVLKVVPLAVKGIELLMVIGVPDDGVTVIS
jgi:hypothetical protein